MNQKSYQVLNDPAEKNFYYWLRCNGMSKHQVYFAYFQNTQSRGLMATRNLKSHDYVVRIPRKILITTEAVMESSHSDLRHVFRAYHNQNINSSSNLLKTPQVLSVFLIYERSKGNLSFFYPYIQLLPTSYTIPLYFSRKEIDMLPEDLKARALDQRKLVLFMYQEIQKFWKFLNQYMISNKGHRFEHNSPFSLPKLRYKDFIWAWCTVNTRCVFLDVFKSLGYKAAVRGPDVLGLAPFLDMLNHSNDVVIKNNFNVHDQTYSIQIFDEYRPGQQVYINYGNHDNDLLLFEYGFTIQNNPCSCVLVDPLIQSLLKFSMNGLSPTVLQILPKNIHDTLMQIQHDPYLNKRKKVLLENNLYKDLAVVPSGPTWPFLSACKIFAMEPSQLDKKNVTLFDEYDPNFMNSLKKKIQLISKVFLTYIRASLVLNQPQENQISPSYVDKMILQIFEEKLQILDQALETK